MAWLCMLMRRTYKPHTCSSRPPALRKQLEPPNTPCMNPAHTPQNGEQQSPKPLRFCARYRDRRDRAWGCHCLSQGRTLLIAVELLSMETKKPSSIRMSQKRRADTHSAHSAPDSRQANRSPMLPNTAARCCGHWVNRTCDTFLIHVCDRSGTQNNAALNTTRRVFCKYHA